MSLYRRAYTPKSKFALAWGLINVNRYNYVKDSKLRNFATVIVKEEDHTLGNVVRM